MSRLFRFLADLATLARAGVVGWVLLQVGLGPEGLERVVRLLLLGWSLDVLDGVLARASGRSSPLAAWDYPLDAGLAWAGWAYLAGAGLVPAGFAWAWAVLALVLVSQSAHFCTPTPHQDGSLGFPATSPTIPKGWA